MGSGWSYQPIRIKLVLHVLTEFLQFLSSGTKKSILYPYIVRGEKTLITLNP